MEKTSQVCDSVPSFFSSSCHALKGQEVLGAAFFVPEAKRNLSKGLFFLQRERNRKMKKKERQR